jgi:hypothetical protein
MREIYNRDPNDLTYNPYQIEVTDLTEICIGQIKMLLLTNRGEVLGDPDFGLNFEELVFSLGLSESTLRQQLDLYLMVYVPLFGSLGGTYELNFFMGTQRDIVTLDFSIPSDGASSPIVTMRIT